VNAAPWPAPAKLNLFLHVTGRRADGYHELQTLFQLVDLVDEVGIRARHDGAITRAGGPPGVAAEADLVVRAACLLRETAGEPALGADLSVTKRIPVGAGLGGGSSDAATTLVALNELWGLGLDAAQLMRLGLRLGADVPVFIQGTAAEARGVGEVLTPAAVPPAWFAVVFPGHPVATAGAFQAPELTRNSPVITISGFLSDGWPTRPLAGRNDLEPVVSARHAPVRAALEWLAARGAARMTGSGAAVFAAFGDRAGAAAALEGLPPEWTGFVTAGIARSPLAARLAVERDGAASPGATGVAGGA
jgi:4-diphosphocytidyl-2-C-methyl-D-erythritol kinase